MPVATTRRFLTSEERDHYRSHGYVVVPDVFPLEELGAIDAEIDRLQGEVEAHKNAGWILQLGLRSDVTQRFARDERVLDLIQDIVTPGIAIYSAKLTVKLPRSEDICHWHQDDAYYTAHCESATRMSTWIPMRDATLENGCMWVVPGSHRRGLQTHDAYGGQCPKSMGPADLDVDGALPCPVKAGDVLLFSAMLWHHSKANRTDAVRRAFIVSYQEATVTRGNGKQWTILREAGELDA